MNGFFLIDKPQGMTSTAVLRRLKRKLGKMPLGHGGALDPMATGLLVAAAGKATKLLRFSLGADKGYEAVIRLGEMTDTDDAEGQIIETAPYAHVTQDAVQRALHLFEGPIQQIPPQYSALHVDGKRAYDLARKGVEFELKARDVTMYAIALRDFSPPLFTIDVQCSGGTYIRSLARDLGVALQSLGHIAALHRTYSAPYRIEDAVDLDTFMDSENPKQYLKSMNAVMAHYPRVEISTREARALLHGQRVNFPSLSRGRYRIVMPNDDRLLAMLSIGCEKPWDMLRVMDIKEL